MENGKLRMGNCDIFFGNDFKSWAAQLQAARGGSIQGGGVSKVKGLRRHNPKMAGISCGNC
jgi:hypothetical protein